MPAPAEAVLVIVGGEAAIRYDDAYEPELIVKVRVPKGDTPDDTAE